MTLITTRTHINQNGVIFGMKSLFQQQKIPIRDFSVSCKSKEKSAPRNMEYSILLPFDKPIKKRFQKTIAIIKYFILLIHLPPHFYLSWTLNSLKQRRMLERETDR